MASVGRGDRRSRRDARERAATAPLVWLRSNFCMHLFPHFGVETSHAYGFGSECQATSAGAEVRRTVAGTTYAGPVLTGGAMDEGLDRPTIRPDAEAPGTWEDTIAVADQALEEAARIQRGVQQTLKLQAELRSLREELDKAHAELDRYRGMHARVVRSMRKLEAAHASALSQLEADAERMRVRHRVYRLLAEHYALTALDLDAETFAEHRDRVLQHVLFQKRKGQLISEIRAADLAFLLL